MPITVNTIDGNVRRILPALRLRDFHSASSVKKEYKKHTFMSDVRSGGCYNFS